MPPVIPRDLDPSGELMDVALEDAARADLHVFRARRVDVVVIDHRYTFPPLVLRITDRGRDRLLANYIRTDRDGARRAFMPSLCSAQTVADRRGCYRNRLQKGPPTPAVRRIPSTELAPL